MVYKSGNCGQAIALDQINGARPWSIFSTDLSGLTNYSTAAAASQDYASCENSALIREQGNNSVYPAVWATYNYTTAGTKVGDWCLPAAGIFTSIYNYKSTINAGLGRAGGTNVSSDVDVSSSEYNSSKAWVLNTDSSYGLSQLSKVNNYGVRPVIEF